METLFQLIFVVLATSLFYFFIIYLPWKNKQPKREDMFPIDDCFEDANAICESTHSSAWLKLGRTMEIDGVDRKFMCPICERYRG